MTDETASNRRLWDTLDPAEQTELLEAYGHWLDRLPPTCSLELKIERFRGWLDERGIDDEPGR